jgi:ubiquinone/menaquinone biosynthesis C-methylase UbiE
LPYLAKITEQAGKVVALDLSFEMLKRAKEKHASANITYVQAAAEQLPFKPGKFNRVICFACFPHFENKPVAVIEIARTLRTDGILVIAHAASRGKINAMHTSIGGVLSHDVIPTNAEMYHLLEQSGFSKIRISDETDFYLVFAKKR